MQPGVSSVTELTPVVLSFSCPISASSVVTIPTGSSLARTLLSVFSAGRGPWARKPSAAMNATKSFRMLAWLVNWLLLRWAED
jgi:hypothetical protein